MGLLQLREKEIFEALKQIKACRFAVIGGYAVNAYALPRFSVDCDIVVGDHAVSRKIGSELGKSGYSEVKLDKSISYDGKFVRYEKQIDKDFKVSMDVLIGEVFDRQTGCSFSSKWVFDNSGIRQLRGKTIAEALKLRIISIDALIVMKIICARLPDIRDVFMLMQNANDKNWIKEEISKRRDFEKALNKVKAKVTSVQFRNDLQGVFGYVDPVTFEKHKKAILRLK
ncbi:nucleotidyl transferase AbiEii/AbiGii toxin family protein [Candidatus Woesearchaeota archaeon]|nr:nucleotidyl transferase AbiEii/AbiGii toxin family protein [Candidatus Woesearchaeota archaeon]